MFKALVHALVLILAALAVVAAVKYLSENAPSKDSLNIDGLKLPISEFVSEATQKVANMGLNEANKEDALRRYTRLMIESEIRNRLMADAPEICREDPEAYYEYFKSELKKHKISCPEFPEIERHLNMIRKEK